MPLTKLFTLLSFFALNFCFKKRLTSGAIVEKVLSTMVISHRDEVFYVTAILDSRVGTKDRKAPWMFMSPSVKNPSLWWLHSELNGLLGCVGLS